MADTQVAIGILVGQHSGPALYLSFMEAKVAAAEWAVLQHCQYWNVTQRGGELHVTAYGEQFPVGPGVVQPDGQVLQAMLQPFWSGEWSLPTSDITLFVDLVDAAGAFWVVPQLLRRDVNLAPILAQVDRKRSQFNKKEVN